MNEELKPCPFCGGKAEIKHIHSCVDMQMADDIDTFWIECTVCHSASASNIEYNIRYTNMCKELLDLLKIKTIKSWNKRVELNED